MMSDGAHADTIRSAEADRLARSETHLQHCILLAVVTSEDVAAGLIDQAIALRTSLDGSAAPSPAFHAA